MSAARVALLWLAALWLSACGLTNTEPTLTPSPLPTLQIASFTPTASPTITPSPLPSATSTLSPSLTAAPTLPPSPIPPTATPTPLPFPSATPYPVVSYTNDQWERFEVPRELEGGLDRSWLAFLNYTDRTRQTTPDTDSLADQQSLYLVRPDSRQRLKIADIPATTGERVFWSPTGMHIAYFMDATPQQPAGLYMLDLRLGLKYRVFDMPSLNPRGILGHTPSWSNDGQMLAVALPTAYATDIFILNVDGSNYRNITEHGSYDLWPVFSPDGLWLAFVSDRVSCPTWEPLAPDTCNRPDAPPPSAGNLFVLNMNTGDLRQITDIKVSGAPRWITNSKLAFSTGGGNPLATSSDLWLADIEAGSATPITPSGFLSINESWSRDASRVVYQQAGASTSIILADSLGRTLFQTNAYIFARYGMIADWSPDGQYLAIGGRNGQCPYGILVVDPNFEVVTAPVQTLLACDPKYSPTGNYLAFTAIQPATAGDGRLDIYLANPSGVGARKLTADLRGQITLLGWVGPTPFQAN